MNERPENGLSPQLERKIDDVTRVAIWAEGISLFVYALTYDVSTTWTGTVGWLLIGAIAVTTYARWRLLGYVIKDKYGGEPWTRHHLIDRAGGIEAYRKQQLERQQQGKEDAERWLAEHHPEGWKPPSERRDA